MPRIALLLAALAALAGCTGAPFSSAAPDDALVVRAGTSFGMCAGYCVTELRIDTGGITLTETPNRAGELPPRVRRIPITDAEWAEISQLAGAERFAGLEERYGCPDCADGGAEWVEVERDGARRRVTFEYGAAVERIQPLIERTRALRARLEAISATQ